jgi:ectoine hydroxylase-related dioxygenase (phytanoyl-CoA dioxygenase family)
MAPVLDESQIQEFERVGAIRVRNALSLQWRDVLEKGYAEVVAVAEDLNVRFETTVKKGPDKGLMKDATWRVSAMMDRFMRESPIAELAAAALRSREVRLYEDLLLVKGADAVQPSAWHQDITHWPLSGFQMCSVWMTLDPVTMDTGAMSMVAGSHRGPHYTPNETMPPAHRHLFSEPGGKIPDVDADPERFPQVGFETEPGDVVIFHPTILHAAFGISPGKPRRTFTFRLVGDDARWRHRPWVHHDWLRAVDLPIGATIANRPEFPLLWPRQAA